MQGGFITGKNWQKNGKTLKLTLTTNTQRTEIASIIKNNLEQIGLETKINEISNEYYKKNFNSLSYQMLLTGNIVSIKPEIQNYLNFNIEKKENTKDTYDNVYKIFEQNPNFTGLYFNSIILVHVKNLKGNFTGNWYNVFYNIDTWYKLK